MELERLCKRVSNLQNSIERAYTKDLSNILNDIFFEYDIFYKNTNEVVQKEILLRRFLSVFGKQPETHKICLGISQNGNKCCKRAQEESDYCKTHKYLEFRQRVQNKDTSENLFVIENSVVPKNLDVSQFKTHLIDDTFYYIDSSFIYDKQTLERVGYIEGDKFVLTDDPFVLCL